MLPGTIPPISAWWARLAVANRSATVLGVMHRRDDGDIGQVRAAAVGIVGDERRRPEQIGPTSARMCLTVSPIAPRCTGICGAVDDQFAGGREDRATEVETLLHIRRDGRPLQRGPHLLGNRGEKIVENLQLDRIDFGRKVGRLRRSHVDARAASSPTGKTSTHENRDRPRRSRSARKRWPGRRIRRPGAGRSRRNTSVACGAAGEDHVSLVVRASRPSRDGFGDRFFRVGQASPTTSTRAAVISIGRPA